MEKITMFYLDSCPYCNRARNYMQELQDENAAFADLEIIMIEEREQADLADQYDYYYVPTYYVGEDKIAEGAIDKNGVQAVFQQACGME